MLQNINGTSFPADYLSIKDRFNFVMVYVLIFIYVYGLYDCKYTQIAYQII